MQAKILPFERAHYGDFMTSKSDLDLYRERVFTAMKAAGLPIDQWQRQHEEELSRDPTAKSRPFITLTPPKYGQIQKLRPGFEEFIPHPRHGKPVLRCQAARKRTGGREQCKKFAANGTHLCRTHGGAKGSGKISDQGRLNQVAAVTKHGNETRIKRTERSRATNEMRELEKNARKAAMMNGKGSRGPYCKPNRVGQAMGHLRKI